MIRGRTVCVQHRNTTSGYENTTTSGGVVGATVMQEQQLVQELVCALALMYDVLATIALRTSHDKEQLRTCHDKEQLSTSHERKHTHKQEPHACTGAHQGVFLKQNTQQHQEGTQKQQGGGIAWQLPGVVPVESTRTTTALHSAALALLQSTPQAATCMPGGHAAAVLCGWAVLGVQGVDRDAVEELKRALLERAEDGHTEATLSEIVCRNQV